MTHVTDESLKVLAREFGWVASWLGRFTETLALMRER